MPHSGTPPAQSRQAAAALYVLSAFSVLRLMIDHRRSNTADRFRQPTDWIRLVALGIILINIAALSFVNMVPGREWSGYRPGMGAIYGGMIIGIIIIRIARPALYLDWITAALLQTWLGLILFSTPELGSPVSFALFELVFTALAILRLRIGITAPPGKSSASLVAGGGVSIFCLLWMLIDHAMPLGIAPDIVVTTDLMLTGVSIVGFGLALRKSSSPKG